MAYGSFVLMRDLTFAVRRGAVFVVMGGSGSGKSTLLRHLIGLNEPAAGEVFYGDVSFTRATPEAREGMLRRFGVLYQSGALFSSLTLAENVGLPLGEYTHLSPAEIREVAALKLALVGLRGFEDYYPSQISGGMQKRAGLARAIALVPELRHSLGATVVVVTHELASIFAIADDSVFLDADSRTIIASGPPRELLAQSADPRVHAFLTRGEERPGAETHG